MMLLNYCKTYLLLCFRLLLPDVNGPRPFLSGRFSTAIKTCAFCLTISVAVSACNGPAGPLQQVQVPVPAANSRIVTDLSQFIIPTDVSEAAPQVKATVNTTNGRRANVRSGPGTDFTALAAADSGTEFDVLAQNEAGDWWQICCVAGADDAEGEATTTAWLADIVVELEGDIEDVPVYQAILPEDLSSRWQVNWECGSDRCDIKRCTATVEARVDSVSAQQWLELDHTVTWDETCFSTDEWTFEVNRFTGLERSNTQDENFLYRYWVGPNSGEVNSVYKLRDGRQIAAWCSGPHTLEVEEGEGWSTVYIGNSCHDVRTGMLLDLSYEKRWLFTGEFEGQTYNREYFGDFETLEQHLADTSAELFEVEEK